jgi:A/G-specific adenine glycosylase
MLLIIDGDQILLEQRPDKGIWGGLLSLPEMDAALQPGNADFDLALTRATAAFGVPQAVEQLAGFSHVFTHFKLHVTPYRITLAQRPHIAAQGNQDWYRAEKMAAAPLPAPIKKLLLAVFREPDLLSGNSTAQAGLQMM